MRALPMRASSMNLIIASKIVVIEADDHAAPYLEPMTLDAMHALKQRAGIGDCHRRRRRCGTRPSRTIRARPGSTLVLRRGRRPNVTIKRHDDVAELAGERAAREICMLPKM